MISISVTRATKVFDVTVIGGGTAGVFAAIAAALCAANKTCVSEVDIADLRRALSDIGAILP